MSSLRITLALWAGCFLLAVSLTGCFGRSHKAVQETAEETTAVAQEETKPAGDEVAIRFAIYRLTTSGWREGWAKLIEEGEAAVPFLIDELAPVEEGGKPQMAYLLAGHMKADASRPARPLTLAEVCAEVLTDIIRDRSNYKGEDLPAVDQKAWQDWWSANCAKITFAK